MAGTNWGDHMKTKECDFYKARITAGSSLRTIPKIRGKLNPRQLKKFEETCFGHFLRVSDLQLSAQLCHHILLREVDHKTNLEDMWFYIGGDDISRFSIVEFCLVTGLRYSKNKESSHKIDEGLEERIRHIHFNSAMKITVQTLESYFDDYVSMDEENDDIVKLALLLFLEVTLMGKDERQPVDYVYMQSVDNLDAFNALPWGSSIYKRTFDSLSKCCEGRSEKFKKKREEKPSHKEERYNIYGFVYAFQVWAYETIPSYAEKNYAKRISKEIPRILSWEALKIPTFDDLRNEIFSRQAVPPLCVLKSTEEERQQSFFIELLERDVPLQDDLVKGVDDLSSEISSLRLEVVARQEEITSPENVIISPEDDKENDHGLREGECEVHDEVSEIAQNPVLWPSGGQLTFDWILGLMSIFNWSSKNIPPHNFPSVFPLAVFDNLVSIASKILRKEPNCVKIDGLHHDSTVMVVGDIHGQLHDLLFLLRDAGFPSEARFFIFNGDYVDRGAWGLETFLLLLAWKVFLPHRVCLLRGNHETKYCTSVYGFKKEVLTKYGDEGIYAYQKCLNCFKELPLASIIAGKVYTAHGGLFRSIPVTHSKRSKGKKKRNISSSSEASSLSIGTLEQLFKARRSVLDPPGEGSNLIPSDVLWSDPSSNKKCGLSLNEDRCIGLLWGPDCTENFLKNSNLKLIIRSHEGPDARDKRPDMEGMDNGFTIDHCVASGKLITLFSAPDYPQFQATEDRYNNKGAYVVLRSPNFDEPEFHVFKAVTPRPKANPFYDFENVIDSDEEIDLTSMAIS